MDRFSKTDADRLIRRRVQSHRRTVPDNEVSGGGIHGVARDAGRVARTPVIIAQVQQTAAFHIDRASAGDAVILDRQFIQNQVAAALNN